MKKTKIMAVAVLFILALAILATGCNNSEKSTKANTYPKDTISFIVTFEAGGGVDTFARTVAKYSEKYVKAPMTVINKSGAGGEIGWTAGAKAKPDGYTIIATISPTTIIQPKVRKEGIPGYQPEDLEPVALFNRLPSAMLVRKDSQFKTLQDLVDYARKNPGKLTLTNNGSYGVDHVFTLILQKELGINVKRVVFKGGSESLKEVLAGNVDVLCSNAMWAVQQADNLRPLAIAGEERFSLTPDVPTFKDQGFNVVNYITREISVPKGTPKEIKDYLNEAFKAMAADKEFQKELEQLGLPVTFMDMNSFTKFRRSLESDIGWIIDEFKKEMK
ncbi:MAG: Bug family tripartite tricarboxylate transporter substrate binding protein [Bacillota bacterium]